MMIQIGTRAWGPDAVKRCCDPLVFCPPRRAMSCSNVAASTTRLYLSRRDATISLEIASAKWTDRDGPSKALSGHFGEFCRSVGVYVSDTSKVRYECVVLCCTRLASRMCA